ncbi:hypothetical protein HK100_012494, partial [Physocladia obscura]
TLFHERFWIGDLFSLAAQVGAADVVDILRCDKISNNDMFCGINLENLRSVDPVDPGNEDDLALRLACRYGHRDIIMRLLYDLRVNPNGRNTT